MAEDDEDDLEAYWADVRPAPRSLNTPRLELPPTAAWSVSPETILNALTKIAVVQGHATVTVQVGLFTADGEVTGAGYTRVTGLMHIERHGIRIDSVQFPPAQEPWGTVLTAGIFTRGGKEPVFYLNLPSPVAITYSGDSLTLHLHGSV